MISNCASDNEQTILPQEPVSIPVRVSTPADTSLADKELKLGLDSKPDSAFVHFQLAASVMLFLAKEMPDSLYIQRFRDVCLQVGKYYRNSYRFYLSRWWLERGLYEEVLLGEADSIAAESLFHLGRVNNELGAYSNSLENLNKALQMFKSIEGDKSSGAGKCLNGLAITYQDNGEYESALEYYEAALNQRKLAAGPESSSVASTLSNMGTLYDDMGNYQRSLEYFFESLRLKKKIPGKKGVRTRAHTWLYLGLAYKSMEDYDNAILNIEKCIQARESVYGKEHQSVATGYFNLGLVYALQEDYQKADKLYRLAYDMRLKSTGKKDRRLATYNDGIASVRAHLGDYVASEELYQQSLQMRKELFGNKHREVALSYRYLADVMKKTDRLDLAIQYQRQAIEAFIYTDFDTRSNEQIPLDYVSDQAELLKTYELLAGLYFQESFNAEDPSKQLSIAYHLAETAAVLLIEMRSGYRFSESSQILWGKRGLSISELGIKITNRLFQQTGNIEWLEKAFESSERAKAVVLAELLKEAKAIEQSGVSSELVEQEKATRNELRNLENRRNRLLIPQTDEAGEKRRLLTLETVQAEYFAQKKKYIGIRNDLENSSENDDQPHHLSNKVSLDQIQKELRHDEAMVTFCVTDSNVFTFALTGNDIHLHSQRHSQRMKQNLSNYYKSMASFEKARFSESASELYEALLRPVEHLLEHKTSLLIIPDGQLLRIPLDGLLTQQSSNKDLKQLPYLVHKYSTTYHYSTRLWYKARQERSEVTQNEFVGFAPVFKRSDNKNVEEGDTLFEDRYALRNFDRDGLPRHLPASERELAQIGELFRENKRFLFFHRDATEKNLKSNLVRQSRIIHIASHGKSNLNQPGLSAIYLYGDDASENPEDGTLYVTEIYDLDLQAELVVLSACETGFGKIYPGEGVMALPRGFLYAGAKNVLFSIWAAADGPSEILMTTFYKEIAKGKEFSKALRQAKLHMIQNTSDFHPGFWANFVLVGSN